MSYSEPEDRSLAYASLSTASLSVPASAKTGRLQMLGASIVQRRVRLATAPATELTEMNATGVGLKALGVRSRTGTSPLVELQHQGEFLTKSTSFQTMPPPGIRFIDETKIEEHRVRTQTLEPRPQRRVNTGRQQFGQRLMDTGKGLFTGLYWVLMLGSILGVAFSGSVLFSATTSTWHHGFGGSSKFKTAAVASEQEICSKVGVSILKSGGNAVDSAIASLLCVGAINNFSCGVGGGGFMLIRANSSYSTVIDYRETAPAGVKLEDYENNPRNLIEGGMSVGVPSQIKGIAMAHQKFGKLKWADLFEPTIALCEQGFPVTPKLAKVISKWAGNIKKSAAMRETYLKREQFRDNQVAPTDAENGEKWVPKTESDIVKRPNLARTLEMIASMGADAFYKGSIADAMVAENRAHKGMLTNKDLTDYEPIEREPIVGEFSGYKVTVAGAPASGAPLLQILKVLEQLGLRNATSPNEKHLFIEALKFGYASRIRMADPGFYPDIVKEEEEMLKADTIKGILGKIDPVQTHQPDYYTDVFGDAHDHGTTHLAVLDRDGMAVSVTDTVNLEFGSFIMDSETGILQNNEMGDFSVPKTDNAYGLPPSDVNYVKAGKRPVSSATPIILERDGQVVLVTGAAGGSRIISVTAQMIMDLLLYKMEPAKAMVDSRIHHQLFPNEAYVDHETTRSIVDGLKDHGHKVMVLPPDTVLTSLQLIFREANGEIWALSDPRKGGLADGY